ncbi:MULTISPECIES: SDR family oxidoreductase [Streptomyces]|uniref:2-deoxy-D-gluconate 3-dehydrogenase n=1 Tax=Streptomyces stelliscabiei TaxID=146820 RepID=A0A8I0PH06_9ACTN|nr:MULTISPECIES: SDR family oxidoreductase [Streptomyces]KND41712.1 2-deoxy-D-gluconate 3-dehydrogenase [Streptomyces stelliscabiei]MBE1602386.1 2-deoxy-D-gluconate 3-dehydrogenase [Streptomyces stelliscabiei]MDX2521246.1 SDR family oxidoreductase [Streptomyces stelliscabiei]MDX2550356.1 SDR family oxidoreductase [Streptomyces stelliscabiei]MDX2610054.1 SDR family oxidoreductase [Streptomyces stelliscabiei]
MTPSSFDLTGKLAVVTGARRGIGRAMARALAEAGADIIGVSATLEESGSEVEKDVLAANRSFEAIRTDFADPDAVRALGEDLAGRERPVDILVNNAGTIRRAPAAQHPDEDWELVLQVNLTAQFALTRAVGAAMVARGSGKVVFTASLLSFQGGITVPGYTAAKHGIAGLTKALANEWAPHGVNVNALAPGYIATDNTQALRDDPARSTAILERIPAGRWGNADDLAGATVFLASDAAAYIHGTVLPVDGGWLGR